MALAAKHDAPLMLAALSHLPPGCREWRWLLAWFSHWIEASLAHWFGSVLVVYDARASDRSKHGRAAAPPVPLVIEGVASDASAAAALLQSRAAAACGGGGGEEESGSDASSGGGGGGDSGSSSGDSSGGGGDSSDAGGRLIFGFHPRECAARLMELLFDNVVQPRRHTSSPHPSTRMWVGLGECLCSRAACCRPGLGGFLVCQVCQTTCRHTAFEAFPERLSIMMNTSWY